MKKLVEFFKSEWSSSSTFEKFFGVWTLVTIILVVAYIPTILVLRENTPAAAHFVVTGALGGLVVLFLGGLAVR